MVFYDVVYTTIPHHPLFQLLAKNPDGTPISDLIVKVVASARGVTSKLFEGDVEIKGGTARLNIGDVPFNAQNVDVRVSSSSLHIYLKSA